MKEKSRERLTPEQREQDKRKAQNVCKLCRVRGHFATKCPKAWCARCQKAGHTWDKCPTFPKEKRSKGQEMEIDKPTEENFKLARHIIKSLPGMITKREMYKSIQKYERKNVNYLRKSGKPKYISTTCEANIQGNEVKAIVDSGAAVSVLSKEIWNKMPYEKLEASKTSLNPFGERKKYASL